MFYKQNIVKVMSINIHVFVYNKKFWPYIKIINKLCIGNNCMSIHFILRELILYFVY
jgi:hypothetical protein